MYGLDWNRLQEYYYGRRKNRVSEEYYRGKFEVISRYFNNIPITYDTIGGFFVHLNAAFQAKNKHEMSNSYRNKFLSVLKVCAKLTGGNIDDYKGDNENLDRVETEKLTVEEYERLLAVTIPYQLDRDYKNFRDRLIIKVAIITTQRIGNIASLTWEDYKAGYFYFRITKNGKPHMVYVPVNIQAEIVKLRRLRYVFGTHAPFDKGWFNDMLKLRCKLAKISKHITGKSMRGTGATEYLKKYHLHQVAKITGHQDIRVLANHYYDPQNHEIEQIVENNPFDPVPLTEEEILREVTEFTSRLIKRNCQVTMIPQTYTYVVTIPKKV